MNDAEVIIKSILDADEIEILEFDFEPCFTLLRRLHYENDKLRKGLDKIEANLDNIIRMCT